MRILRIAQKIYPEVNGGAPYHIHAMSRDQAAMGHDVTVVTVSDNKQLPSYEEKDGYKIIRRSPNIELLGNSISNGVWRSLKGASSYDIVHAHSHMYFSSNLAAVRRKLSETPLAITNHGLYSQNAPKRLFELYLRTAGKWTFNAADLVFCYTEEGEKRIRRFGIKPEAKVVSNGIDQKRFNPSGERSSKMEEDRFVVLSVLRLVEGKRPKDAIDIINMINNEYPEIKLYLCGGGPLRRKLESYVHDQNLQNYVEFLGEVEYDEMPKLYRSCDVLLLPSEAEAGSPRVILEAMATEKPYVTSDLYQVSQLLKNLGKTASVGDIEGFAGGIAELIEDPSLRRGMGKEGRQLVEDEFNWKQTVEGTTEGLKSIYEKYNS